MKKTLHVVSISSGKDSDATLKLALNRCAPGSVIPIFCDTGNEHEEVDVHLEYLERRHGIKIIRLKNDFSDEFARKRMFIARDQRTRREYDTVPVFEADGITPVLKRDGRGNIVMRKVRRGGLMVEEAVQKAKKIGGGVRCAGRTRRSAGRWSQCTRVETHSLICACSRADSQAERPSSARSA